MADNPMIKQITLPSGTTYDIKDAWARERIAAMGDFTYWIGVTTAELTEGSTTNPITVNSESVTASKGGIATYGSKEFAWNGSVWQEFGDLSGLGELAFADTASGSYTPAGSVSKPTFSGTEATISVSGTPAGTVSQPTFTGTQGSVSVSGTPSGTVSKPSFTGTQGSVSVTGTPSGTVSQPTFSGTSGSVSVSGTTKKTSVWVDHTDNYSSMSKVWPSNAETLSNAYIANVGTNSTIQTSTTKKILWYKNSNSYDILVNVAYENAISIGVVHGNPAISSSVLNAFDTGGGIAVSQTWLEPGDSVVIVVLNSTNASDITMYYGGKKNYTPSGTISQPTTTVELNTTTVNSITNVGTLPSCTLPTLSTSVTNEVLTLSWTAGSFSAGTLPTKGSNTTVATGVQSATTTQPTFTGVPVLLGVEYQDETITSTGSFTPEGTVSQPTFSGSTMTSTGNFTPSGSVSQPTFSGSSMTSTGNFTPAGTVSQPTFSGSSLTSTGTYTPAGSVTKPTFSGTAATITVEPDTPTP